MNPFPPLVRIANLRSEEVADLSRKRIRLLPGRVLTLVALLILCAAVSARAQQTFSNFQPASVVTGQADFTDQVTTGSQTVTAGPTSVAVSVTGKMAVGDPAGNRVLIWNSIPGANGAPADV